MLSWAALSRLSLVKLTHTWMASAPLLGKGKDENSLEINKFFLFAKICLAFMLFSVSSGELSPTRNFIQKFEGKRIYEHVIMLFILLISC